MTKTRKLLMHAYKAGLGPIMWLSLPRRVSSSEQQNSNVRMYSWIYFLHSGAIMVLKSQLNYTAENYLRDKFLYTWLVYVRAKESLNPFLVWPHCVLDRLLVQVSKSATHWSHFCKKLIRPGGECRPHTFGMLLSTDNLLLVADYLTDSGFKNYVYDFYGFSRFVHFYS
jgi:hypothetical protein